MKAPVMPGLLIYTAYTFIRYRSKYSWPFTPPPYPEAPPVLLTKPEYCCDKT